MGRNKPGLFAAWTLLYAVLSFPQLARADVLEISGSQSSWIARGSGGLAALEASAESDPQIGAPGTNNPPGLTQVADAAGPAEWRSRVGELAAKYDISPALLEAVVWQESRWRTDAVSPVGARGLAQLMPGTAREMGVDAASPSANLEGGARYLRIQLDSFGGDVEKALAAYNAGPARVKRAGGIPRITETQQYVAAIMSRLANPVRR